MLAKTKNVEVKYDCAEDFEKVNMRLAGSCQLFAAAGGGRKKRGYTTGCAFETKRVLLASERGDPNSGRIGESL